jgi:hypothetical protein
MGAECFYSRIVDELGIGEFQINTRLPGGPSNRVKDGYPLDSDRLALYRRLFAGLEGIAAHNQGQGDTAERRIS